MQSLIHILLSADYPTGEHGVTLEGLENVEYWLGGFIGHVIRFLTTFAAFSWQVKFSVFMALFCTAVIVYMSFKLCHDIRKRHKIRRLELDTYSRYSEAFRQVITCKNKLEEKDIVAICGMEAEEIFQSISPDPKIAVRVLASVIMQVRLELIRRYENDDEEGAEAVDHEILYLPNITILCDMFRVREMYENNLEKRRDVLKTLQDMLTLTLPLTEGYLAIYTGHGNKDIKYMSRMCYVFCTQAEPYKYMAEDLKGNQPLWYPMMLHRLLGWLKQTNHPMPKFHLLASETNNPESAAFLIKEISFWGSQEDKQRVKEFLSSPHYRCVEAALQVIGTRGNVEAETAIQETYSTQPEFIRRKCLKALSRINSGRSTEFFVRAFEESSSLETRTYALECLLTYGEVGMRRFIELSRKYESDESLSNLIYGVQSIELTKQSGYIK